MNLNLCSLGGHEEEKKNSSGHALVVVLLVAHVSCPDSMRGTLLLEIREIRAGTSGYAGRGEFVDKSIFQVLQTKNVFIVRLF